MLESIEKLMEFVGDMNATEINDHIKARPDGFVVSFRIDNEWLDGWNRAVLATVEKIEKEVAERYVELPKDADGEYVHVGDVMESGDGDVFTVSSVDYGLHPSNGRGKFWKLWNEDADFYECAYECRHHHAPTVEDVLREFADEVYADTENEIRDRDFLCAKYAKRLQLREVDE